MTAAQSRGQNQQDYLCRRVVDALLREDVRDIVSKGHIVPAADAPLVDPPVQPSHWLAVDHLGDGCLWIPVQPCTFMQDMGALRSSVGLAKP